jgi:hypothetical protein
VSEHSEDQAKWQAGRGQEVVAPSRALSPARVAIGGWTCRRQVASRRGPLSHARSFKVQISGGSTRSSTHRWRLVFFLHDGSAVELLWKLRPQAHDGGSSSFYSHKGGGDHVGPELVHGDLASTCALALYSDLSKLADDFYEPRTMTPLDPFLIPHQR